MQRVGAVPLGIESANPDELLEVGGTHRGGQRTGTWSLAEVAAGGPPSFASTSWAAAITAAPTPIVEEEPNVGPACGSAVSPISQLTKPGSSPSTSPTIWGKIV